MKDNYRSESTSRVDEPYRYSEPSEQKAKVVNTKRLNVRSDPSLTASVVSIATEGDTLTVDASFNDTTFYKVKTERGVSGYCVKVYLEIQP